MAEILLTYFQMYTPYIHTYGVSHRAGVPCVGGRLAGASWLALRSRQDIDTHTIITVCFAWRVCD